MWIERLRLVDYRRFDRLVLEFAPGLNLLRGPNESGKSTVIAAILACLFESPSSGSAEVRASHRWGAAGAPVIEMEIREGERRYRLSKDFRERKAVLEEPGGEIRLETRKAVDSAVAEMVGFSGADAFARTACVTQGQVAGLATDAAGARKMAAMLREVVIGSGESDLVDAAHAELKRSVEELRKGLDRPAGSPGIVKRLSGEKEALTLRLQSAAGLAEEMERNRARLTEIERELIDKTPELDRKTALLEKNLESAELEKRRERAAGDFDRARAVELAGERLMLVPAEPTAAPRVWQGWALASVGVLLSVIAAYLGTLNAALLVLLVPGIALIAAGAYLVGLPERRTALRRKTESERAPGPDVGPPGVSTFPRGQQADVAEASRRASLEVAALEARLGELAPFRVEPERLAALEREVEELQSDVRGLERERDSLEFHMSRAPVEPDEVLALEEELEFVTAEEERERRRLRVYSIALEAMGLTREKLLSPVVPALEASLGLGLARITGGRYDRVLVSESDLGVSVYSPEKGGMVNAQELLSTLSAGTVEQLYLAARLGLVELLAGAGKPPLIFDDSFAHFDYGRLERVWEMLEEISREYQVILFTCTSRYDALSSDRVNIIDLPPPPSLV